MRSMGEGATPTAGVRGRPLPSPAAPPSPALRGKEPDARCLIPKIYPRLIRRPYSPRTGLPKRDHDEWLAGRGRWAGSRSGPGGTVTVISMAEGSTGRTGAAYPVQMRGGCRQRQGLADRFRTGPRPDIVEPRSTQNSDRVGGAPAHSMRTTRSGNGAPPAPLPRGSCRTIRVAAEAEARSSFLPPQRGGRWRRRRRKGAATDTGGWGGHGHRRLGARPPPASGWSPSPALAGEDSRGWGGGFIAEAVPKALVASSLQLPMALLRRGD
jgi:hypothetical protein